MEKNKRKKKHCHYNDKLTIAKIKFFLLNMKDVSLIKFKLIHYITAEVVMHQN